MHCMIPYAIVALKVFCQFELVLDAIMVPPLFKEKRLGLFLTMLRKNACLSVKANSRTCLSLRTFSSKQSGAIAR